MASLNAGGFTMVAFRLTIGVNMPEKEQTSKKNGSVMTSHLHFTFGPVQGFVAQARRTRDLYSGSFLLSWLAYKAMSAVPDAGEKITLPKFEKVKDLVEVERVKHGVAPNRFVAKFSSEQAAADAATKAVAALQDEWKKIACAIWEKFVDPVAGKGNKTGEIWRRQTENFWEISWAIGSADETDLLDRRKNWRAPPATTESGDHCALMGHHQELSGFIRSRSKEERDGQDGFWLAMREHAQKISRSSLNLAEGERLCAIALIKRFFPEPEITRKIVERDLGADQWPSTVDLAAKPFFRTINDNETCRETLRNFPKFKGEGEHFGQYLNRVTLANREDTLFVVESERRQYMDALKNLEETTNDRAGGFYALLLMDGDRMGKLIREKGAGTVTAALTYFSGKAPGIVSSHDGVCIYAGGDDLFALLPMDKALDCAVEVSKKYRESFNDKQIPDAAISAAVIFAHYNMPLRQVIRQAHYFLDHVAKDQADRNAIAIAVLKPGGETCRWAGKFDRFGQSGAGGNIFTPLIENFSDKDENRKISSKFLYALRSRFGALEDERSGFTNEQLVKLFVSEFIHAKIANKTKTEADEIRAKATGMMEQLLSVCLKTKEIMATDTDKLDFDGARLVRFLALKGKEGNDR